MKTRVPRWNGDETFAGGCWQLIRLTLSDSYRNEVQATNTRGGAYLKQGQRVHTPPLLL